MTLGSLFDGIGGFPLCAAMCGISPIWASEIEAYPMRVTGKMFPKMRQLGDVTKINGAEIDPVDVITFGSPCQDLSIAGKQAGIHEGARSSLFFEAIRIIHEMREATNGLYPTFAVWENVPGAFSSHSGEDFKAVLEAFLGECGETDAVPMPKGGKWNGSGCVMGNGFSVAWRVLDAQYWGVPQRRRRIYLVADFRGERAGKILFEREGLRRDIAQGGEAREGTAEDARGSVGRSCGVRCLTPWDCQSKRIFLPNGKWPTLQAMDGGGASNTAILYDMTQASDVVREYCGVSQTLQCRMGTGGNQVPFACFQIGIFMGGQGAKARGIGYDEAKSPTLKSVMSGGNTVPDIVYALQGNCIDRADTAGCNGIGARENQSYTLDTIDRHAVAYAADCRNFALNEELSGTLQAKDNGDQSLNFQNPILYEKQRIGQYSEGRKASTMQARMYKSADDLVVKKIVLSKRKYIIRRLTPLECCRLQGYPDFWNDVEGSDSAKYKAYGNSLAIPCALYVMEGIADGGEMDA